MECYPVDIEQKLGFDVVRRSVEGRLQTTLGGELWDAATPISDLELVANNLRAASEWQEALRGSQAPGLAGMPDLTEALRRIGPAGSWLEPLEILDITVALGLARQLGRFFGSGSERYPTLAAACHDLYVDQALEKRLSRIVDEQGNVRDDASPDLRRIRKDMLRQQEAIRTAADRALGVARDAGYDAGEAPTIRGGRMVIPVRIEGRRKLPGSIVDTSATGKTAFLEPEACIELGNELRLLESFERREIVRILTEATDSVRDAADGILRNQDILARQDLFRAKAHLANELGGVVPHIGDGSEMRLERAYNPALALLRRQPMSAGGDSKPVVPLDLTLSAPDRTLVISGPNAGGKSVAMKTVGLMALMLSHGIPTPCRESSVVPLFARLLVDVGDDQSLENDLSTFSSHLANLKQIVERAGPSTLVLVDEIGTGTDPAAGESIARAVLEHLTARAGFTIVTTHFGGLKALAQDAAGMVNGAMRFDPEHLEPIYVFEPGVPGSSYALEIAQRASFPSDLLAKAREFFGSERSRVDELVLELSKEKAVLERQATEIEERLKRAAEAEKRYDHSRARLEAARESVLRQAHDRADTLLKDANRAIERTIREIKESQAEKAATAEARARLDHFKEEMKARKPRAATRRPEAAKKPEEDHSLKPGDHVVLDGGTAVGEILRMEGKHAVVAFDLAEMRVDVSRLARTAETKKKSGRAISGQNVEHSLSVTYRLDLRGQRVTEAIAAVEKYLDDALRSGLRRVELLHGTGTGALRDAIRTHLASMEIVDSVEEAPVDQGGAGVTFVFLI